MRPKLSGTLGVVLQQVGIDANELVAKYDDLGISESGTVPATSLIIAAHQLTEADRLILLCDLLAYQIAEGILARVSVQAPVLCAFAAVVLAIENEHHRLSGDASAQGEA